MLPFLPLIFTSELSDNELHCSKRERRRAVGRDRSFYKDQQFSVLLFQAKITFKTQGSLPPQILFRMSGCGAADSLVCCFIFDSVKFTPGSHKSVIYLRINTISNKGPFLLNWTVHYIKQTLSKV